MPSAFTAVPVAVLIDGILKIVLLTRYQNQVGSAPAEAEFSFYANVVSDVDISAIKGKICILTINGMTYLTGYITDIQLRYEDAQPGGIPECEVVCVAVDYRWLLSGDYIGRKHLDTLDASGVTTAANGLPVLGADVIFNRQTPFEHANMNILTGIFLGSGPVAPDFVYNKSDGTITDPNYCNTTDATYWTYGDAIYWVLTNYATSITKISVAGLATTITPASYHAAVGNFIDLQRPCEEIDIFGMPIAAALDELFSRTSSNWYLDGSNTLVIFSRQNPQSMATLQPADPLSPVQNEDYSLNIPCKLKLLNSIRNVSNKVEIIGGTTIREIYANPSDFLGPTIDYGAQLTPPPNLTVASSATAILWTNYSRVLTVRYPFKHSAYGGATGHKCGKNIRAKDIAKPLMGDLLVRRTFEGKFVNPDNECGVYSVPTSESILPIWYYGATVDLDRSEISALAVGQLGSTPSPQHWVMPVETEIRAWQEASKTLASLPFDRYAAVIRNDLRQKNRETIHIPFPVDVSIIQAGGSFSYTVLNDNIVPLPSGWAKDYASSGSGTTIPNFTVSVPAGVIYDALGALQSLATQVQTEVGRELVQLEGSFPAFRSLPLGTQLTLTGGGWSQAATGQECVVACQFDGQTHEFSFAATNYVGPSATDLAKGFIARANYRRGI